MKPPILNTEQITYAAKSLKGIFDKEPDLARAVEHIERTLLQNPSLQADAQSLAHSEQQMLLMFRLIEPHPILTAHPELKEHLRNLEETFASKLSVAKDHAGVSLSARSEAEKRDYTLRLLEKLLAKAQSEKTRAAIEKMIQ
jgi:hypothetical protein